MANISSFAITIALSGSVANPVNSLTFQAIAPWGASDFNSNPYTAVEDVMCSFGNMNAGKMGAYFSSQTLNGASGSGPTGYTTANQS